MKKSREVSLTIKEKIPKNTEMLVLEFLQKNHPKYFSVGKIRKNTDRKMRAVCYAVAELLETKKIETSECECGHSKLYRLKR